MLLASLKAFIARTALLSPEAPVLAGASGGLDSTVLVDVLHQLGYAVVVAHVNFGLRGDDAAADECQVRALASARDLPCHVAHRSAVDYAEHFGVSIQMAARELRYKEFADLAARLQLPFVAVGHHAGDQAETVLFNLARGSGPEGLAGMSPARPLGGSVLVRPLLGQTRAAIRRYAQEVGLSWREDVSNSDPKYRRTGLRHVVVPALQEAVGSGAVTNIAHSAALMREYVEATFRPALRDMFCRAAQDKQLSLKALDLLPAVWQRRVILEALRRWLPGAPISMVAQTMPLLTAQPGRRVACGAGVIWRGREALVFDPAPAFRTPLAIEVGPGKSIEVDGKRFSVTLSDTRPEVLDADGPAVAYVDGDRLVFPLLVRYWRSGDRMMPLGMTRRKKVSDVLTDAKVCVAARASTLVVLSGDEIVWVVGVRLAAPFRVRPQTRRFARLALT